MNSDERADLENSAQSSRIWFVRTWALFGLVLFSITWKLWTPQTVFPQVPLLGWFVNASAWLDWLSFGLLATGLVVILVVPDKQNFRWMRIGCVTLVAGFALSCVLDQHRLQPWAWHWTIFALLLTYGTRRQFRFWARLIVTSIYVYSAVSKFDYQFGHTIGLDFLKTMFGLVGSEASDWPNDVLFNVVMLLPLAELLIGLGLIFPVTRRAAVVAGTVMHVALIVVLGPLGMNHHLPVLIWNGFFIVQLLWLFWPRPAMEKDTDPHASPFLTSLAAPVAMFVLVFPATSNFGGCDHWLAWEVYAPRSSRVVIDVRERDMDSLPDSAQSSATPAGVQRGVSQLDLSAWSLETLNVPVYPQARFQLGVALAVSEDVDVLATSMSQSNRWTGEREEKMLTGTRALREAASQFRVNALPRSLD